MLKGLCYQGTLNENTKRVFFQFIYKSFYPWCENRKNESDLELTDPAIIFASAQKQIFIYASFLHRQGNIFTDFNRF